MALKLKSMRARYARGIVVAQCSNCGAPSAFAMQHAGQEFGAVIADGHHVYNGRTFVRILYYLLRCSGCGQGGLEVIHDNGQVADGELETFYPASIEVAPLPNAVLLGVVN